MLDFTSALYLGLRHPSSALAPWSALTSGRPAALAEPPEPIALAQAVARLQGCEAGVLMPSTLHLFLDLFAMLSAENRCIFWDAGSYPIARWAVARAACRGRPVRRFRHHDPDHLGACLARDGATARMPVVLADGFCPVCGRPAPLADYQDLVGRYGGLLVVDDTQALGVLGADPNAVPPYGRGGGGSLRFAGLEASRVLVGASLAKGLGAPVAVLAGDADWIRRFRALSASRVHCSPPSAAVVSAAAGALRINTRHGERLRQRLAERVRRFRAGLARHGLASDGAAFPVQSLRPPAGSDPVSLYRRLHERGVRSVPLRRRVGSAARLGFLITARHTLDDIDRCVGVLANLVPGDYRLSARTDVDAMPAAVSALSCWR